MQRLGRWLHRFILVLNVLAVVGVVCLLGGPYAAAVDWRDHRVTVQIAQNIDVKNVASRLTTEDFRQINCLATNMYFEAGNQGQKGMAAVGDVVFNRMKSGVFPDRACQVIYQGTRDAQGNPVLNRCQFSWYCDGIQHKVGNRAVYAQAYEVAYNQYLYREKMASLVGDTQYYHTDYVDPHHGVWKNARPVTKIGAHIFFDVPKAKARTARSGGGEFINTRVDKRVTLR